VYDDYFSLLMPFIAMTAVIVLAYFGTRWFAKKYTGMSAGKRMQVIERLQIGPDKYLLLVSVGEKILLLGMAGRSGFTALGTFDASELPLPENPASSKQPFSSILTAYIKKQSGEPKASDENRESRSEGKP